MPVVDLDLGVRPMMASFDDNMSLLVVCLGRIV